jgi:hypothetical protein
MKTMTLLSLLLASTVALAQDPAIDTSAGPAVDTSRRMSTPSGVTSATAPSSSGTTIVGERESPIGLYIMPWRNSGAEQGIDRPARLLEEEALPLDPGTFRRQLDYYSALTAHKQAVGGGTNP